MKAGQLCHRIEIQERVDVQDDYGQAIPTWQSLQSRWAAVQPMSGAQLERARSTYSKATHKVTCRWSAGLGDSTTWSTRRIVFKGRLFDIGYAINVDERNHTLVLYCAEGLNEGG